MGNCDWCNLSEEEKQFQLYENKSWSVFLSDEQDYIGRCILVLKRHCGSMSELTDDEWEELRNLVCKVEACLKTVLGATLCNWSCLMNNFYTGITSCGTVEMILPDTFSRFSTTSRTMKTLKQFWKVLISSCKPHLIFLRAL